MSRVDLAELDFFSPEVRSGSVLSDYGMSPCMANPGTNVFVVTRYNDIREIIRDPLGSRVLQRAAQCRFFQ